MHTPCNGSSSETPLHQREVVCHRYEDKSLCTLDDLIDGIYISGAIFGTEEFRRGLQKENRFESQILTWSEQSKSRLFR